MPICKLILRLDFARPCFPVMDKTGYLFGKLADLSDIRADSDKRFFNNFTENQKDRLLIAERSRSESDYASMQITPTYCACLLETASGFELRAFDREERLQKMLRAIQEILAELGITQLARAGVRISYLGQISVRDAVASFGHQIDTRFREAVANSIGTPTDFGIVVDGVSPSKVKYQLKAGPYSSLEAPKYFERVSAAIGERNGDNFIVDLDMFEEKTTLHVNPAKWAGPLLMDADRLIDELKKIVPTEVRDDVTT